VAVAVAQIGLSLPAVLNGLFQVDLPTSSTQLTWISDAFLVPVTLFELTFGVLGDLFGRKRLLAIGAGLMVAGGPIGFFTPATGSTAARWPSCGPGRPSPASARQRSSPRRWRCWRPAHTP
jgi:MFS family permease